MAPEPVELAYLRGLRVAGYTEESETDFLRGAFFRGAYSPSYVARAREIGDLDLIAYGASHALDLARDFDSGHGQDGMEAAEYLRKMAGKFFCDDEFKTVVH